MQLFLLASAYGFLSGWAVSATFRGERLCRETRGIWITSSLSLMAVLIVNLILPLP
jgi:hypothetical protein